MQKAISFSALTLASLATACSFQVGTNSRGANTPQPAATSTTAPAGTATPTTPSTTPTPKPKISVLGRRPGSGGGTTPTNPEPSPVPPPPAGIPLLAGTNLFGHGTADPTGWKGTFYTIPPATQAMPDLTPMTPAGVLFAKELNVAAAPMTGGFPGIDATRNENFAIRWEAPLIVETEATYSYRLVSDDGTKLSIDGTPIVDNDGTRSGPQEKSGPVHLIVGTHVITVDYFQSTGPVALQVYCTKEGGAEMLCPLKL